VKDRLLQAVELCLKLCDASKLDVEIAPVLRGLLCQIVNEAAQAQICALQPDDVSTGGWGQEPILFHP
jgi:hypothetical protein